MLSLTQNHPSNRYLTRLLYVIEFLIITIIFCHLPTIGDDIANSHAHNLQTLSGIFQTDINMFSTWSSRILINPLMYISTTITPKIVFAIITGLLVTNSVIFLNYHLNSRQRPALTILILLTPFIFPLIELGTAGYIATTVTYLWPIGLATISYQLFNHLNHSKSTLHSVFLAILFITSLLLAANNEQLCVILIILYVFYLISHRNSLQFSHYLPIVPLLIDLSLFLFTPGNHARSIAETKRWLPAFSHYSLIDKLNLGMTTTIQHYLFGFSLIFILFSITLLIVNFKSHPIIAPIPLIITSLTTLIGFILPKYIISYNPTFNHTVIATLILGVTYLIATCYLLHDISLNMLLLTGLLSHVMLGFSPTIYASSTRTFVFCDVILLYLLLKILIPYLNYHTDIIPVIYEIILSLISVNIVVNANIINNLTLIKTNTFPLNFWNNVLHK